MRARHAAIAAAVTVLFAGCHRQEIEDPDLLTALIPLSIDWSESRVSEESTNAVSCYFFPRSAAVATVHVSNNIHATKVALVPGEYDILIFNETTDQSSWSGITFEDTGSFHDFAALGRTNTTGEGNPIYTPQAGEHIIHNPEALACWSMEGFEVTPQMIAYTQGSKGTLSDDQCKEIEESFSALAGIKPQPRTTVLSTEVKIRNLNNAFTLGGVIKGMAAGIYMVSGEKKPRTVTGLFTFPADSSKWDNQTDGSIRQSVLCFGKSIAEPQDYDFELHAVLQWGENPKPWTWDVTGQIQQCEDPDLKISLGISGEAPDQEVDLGELKEGVDVGGWEDENIDIKSVGRTGTKASN
ncbi:MAG: DUF5119 domain-containing protein [Bacteroidales bacterium]